MVKFMVNGEAHTFTGDEEMPLLWYLRDDAKLTGTKFGCGIAQCGCFLIFFNHQTDGIKHIFKIRA